MTNTEYEKSCVTAAQQAARFEGEHKLEQCDKAIAVLEASLKRLQEERREIVNFYNLNKEQYKKRCDEVVLSRGVHNHEQSN